MTLSPSALERHKSQGGPCRASRLSLASNSSPGRLLGTGNRQELNPSGRWGWHGQWRSVQVGASISLERTPNCVIQHLDKGFFFKSTQMAFSAIVVSSLGRPWAESQRTKEGVPVTQQRQALPFRQGIAAQVSELTDTQGRGTGAAGEGGMRAKCCSSRAQQQSLITGCPSTTALCAERCCGSVGKTGD